MELLQVYEKARNEYIDTLRSGYLAFFPYILGNHWQRLRQEPNMGGRKLASLVDLYVEEKNKGKVVTPEYLTKKPCLFEVNERLLKDILLLRAEIVKEMSEDVINEGIANVELCKRWTVNYPELRMTTKQLISIHEMLTFDPKTSEASPVIACNLADTWRILDNSLPERKRPADELVFPQDEPDESVEDDTMTMEQAQEYVLATRGLMSRPKMKKRPRFTTKNVRLFWTLERLTDLESCRRKAIQAISCRRKKERGLPLNDLIFAYWRAENGNQLCKTAVVAKCISHIRNEKRRKSAAERKELRRWSRECSAFAEAEERNRVIVETSASTAESGIEFLDGAVPLKKDDEGERNFHDDAVVLDYIGELQRGTERGKQRPGPISWTPDAIGDLLKARRIARRRKREWEEWAVKEYGGVGFAYNNPDIKYVKVDDLFKEEWAKLRPDMASLSIWTLVSYARKYDNFKKQLVLENNQEDDVKFSREAREREQEEDAEGQSTSNTLYFPASSIPQFDLDHLKAIGVDYPGDREMVDLFLTRQLAKEKQMAENSPLTLPFLWYLEWKKLRPKSNITSGYQLQRKLFLYESVSVNLDKVRPALVQSSADDEPFEKSEPQDDEIPTAPPRSNVFPEDAVTKPNLKQSPFTTSFRIFVQEDNAKKRHRRIVTLHRDYYNGSAGKACDLPVLQRVEDEPWFGDDFSDADDDDYEVANEDELDTEDGDACSRLEPKLQHVDNEDKFKFPVVSDECKLGGYQCNECPKHFYNVNNYGYHKLMHQ